MKAVPPIDLIRVGDAPVADDALTRLRECLAETLETEVTISHPAGLDDLEIQPDFPDATAPEDRRIGSNGLVDALVRRPARTLPGGLQWTLGITAHDLYAPGRPFVFGEATLGGRWALVSAARLGITTGAAPRFIDRLLKESLHELGHLASLDHCDIPECPMSTSATVADIDRKKTQFCESCRVAGFSNFPP